MYISVKSIRQGKLDGGSQVNVSSAIIVPNDFICLFLFQYSISGVVFGMLCGCDVGGFQIDVTNVSDIKGKGRYPCWWRDMQYIM